MDLFILTVEEISTGDVVPIIFTTRSKIKAFIANHPELRVIKITWHTVDPK